MAEISDVQPSAAGGRELSKGVILKPGDSLKVYYVRYEIALWALSQQGVSDLHKGSSLWSQSVTAGKPKP